MTPALFRKFARNWDDYGPAVAIKKGVLFLFQALFDRKIYRIYRRELAGDVAPYPRSQGLEIRLLQQEEEDFIRQIEKMEEWLAGQVRGKLLNGSFCMIALDGEEVVGFNLISFGQVFIPLVRRWRKFHQDEAWSEQIGVRKGYRRHGMGTLLRTRVFEELSSRGVRRLYGGTLVYNKANLALCRKVGLREIVDIHYCNVLGVRGWRFRRVSG